MVTTEYFDTIIERGNLEEKYVQFKVQVSGIFTGLVFSVTVIFVKLKLSEKINDSRNSLRFIFNWDLVHVSFSLSLFVSTVVSRLSFFIVLPRPLGIDLCRRFSPSVSSSTSTCYSLTHSACEGSVYVCFFVSLYMNRTLERQGRCMYKIKSRPQPATASLRINGHKSKRVCSAQPN